MSVTQLHPGRFDERELVRWHDVDLMAQTAIEAHQRGDHVVVGCAIMLPGVFDRVLELTATLPSLSTTTMPGHE